MELFELNFEVREVREGDRVRIQDRLKCFPGRAWFEFEIGYEFQLEFGSMFPGECELEFEFARTGDRLNVFRGGSGSNSDSVNWVSFFLG